ncbi:hypothetical protein M9458_036692, partial [Cirrhinus mrigala]
MLLGLLFTMLLGLLFSMLHVASVLRGAQKVPFVNQAMWLSVQTSIGYVHVFGRAHERVTKRVTNVKDVKRYLNTVTLTSDGLLVVQHDTPLSNTTECIVVP